LTGPEYRGFVGAVQRSPRLPSLVPHRAARFRSRQLFALYAGFSLLVVAAAEAEPVDANGRAREIVRELEAGAGNDAPTGEPITRAKAALERAKSERQKGNEEHARMLDEFALEWAETGRDLVEVSRFEEQARAQEEKLLQAETKVRRARALLEETETRRGRAQTELQHLGGASSAVVPAAPSAAPRPSAAPSPAAAGPATSSTAPVPRLPAPTPKSKGVAP
jgi:hypothetical protein